MDHYVLIWSVCTYVEGRVRGGIDLDALARESGFSLAHIRDVFRRQTGVSLSAYVQQRKIANAAQELLHSEDSILEIALRYGYSCRDVFTRAFRRHTGYSPTEFRAARPTLGCVKLCAGVDGAALPRKDQEEASS